MSSLTQGKTRWSPSSNQNFYRSEEVLNSDKFFLVGRGGHGNFHKGNRAVRSLVADHAVEYVETPRKDRAQISIGLFDRDPLFQELVFVTPRDYVLQRLEKDEEATNTKQEQKTKAQGITLSNGTIMPPTLFSQKRWLSRTRTQSIINKHGSISNIKDYPKGVYIEVGRDWAIDIIDHLCREQAHEIRKSKHKLEKQGSVESAEKVPSKESTLAIGRNGKLELGSSEAMPNEQETYSNAAVAMLQPVPNPTESRGNMQKLEMDRAQALASFEMEAVEGLNALMKSEGSAEGDFPGNNQQQDLSQDNYSDGGISLRINEEDAVVTTGGEILHRFPEDMHFVCGCVGFAVLDNQTFLKLIEAYYHEQIENDSNFRREWEDKLQKLKVRRHVPAILARAREYAKTIGKRQFRLWTAQRYETNGGRLQRLSEEVWSQAKLIEITENTALLKQRLESPLRSILMTLKRCPGLIKEENYLNDANSVVDSIHYHHDSGQSESYSSESEGQEDHGSKANIPDSQKRSVAGSTLGQAEDYNSKGMTHDPLKRSITGCTPSQEFHDSKPSMFDCRQVSSAGSTTADWRTALPILSSDVGDLGEPPSGWLFCRELATRRLITATQVSVIVSNHFIKDHGTSEKHFVADAAGTWRKELPAKRFICWFDASSESSLLSDFERYIRGIRQDIASEKKTKHGLVETVQIFYNELEETRSGAEFFLVFCSAPDPATFASWVLPSHWYDTEGNLLQDTFASIVIIPQQQTPYRWNPELFKQIELHKIHKIPDKKWKDEKPWWCDLPLPNLPPMFSAEINDSIMDKVRQVLDMDGSLVALLAEKGGDQSLPSTVANQFVRKWVMEDPTNRFGLWLSARNEDILRKSFVKAICTLTRLDEFDDEMVEDVSPLWLAKELMALLMHMRKFSPRYQWVVVFSDIPSSANFEDWFFPSDSEWWNSRGRFAFTSSEKEDLQVTVGEDGQDTLRKVPVVRVQ